MPFLSGPFTSISVSCTKHALSFPSGVSRILLQVLQNGSLMGAMFIGQQFLQNVLGYSTLDAGLAILPAAALMVLVAPRSAAIVEARLEEIRFGGEPQRIETGVPKTGPLVGREKLLEAALSRLRASLRLRGRREGPAGPCVLFFEDAWGRGDLSSRGGHGGHIVLERDRQPLVEG